MKNFHYWVRYLPHLTIILLGISLLLFVIYMKKTYDTSQKEKATHALSTQFFDYEDTLFSITEINQKIEHADTKKEQAPLQQQKNELLKKLQMTGSELNTALSNTQKYYNPIVVKRIEAFQLWKKENEEKIITQNENKWDANFLNLQVAITKAITKEDTGFEEVGEAENHKIMSFVPEAIKKLKSHPNDINLCTVMQQSIHQDPKTTASQIAFFEVGAKYCSQYYSDRTTWGLWGVKNDVKTPSAPKKTNDPEMTQIYQKEYALNKQYGSIPYPVYYTHSVMPLIPQALNTLQNSKENVDVCMRQGRYSGPRDPKQDALRAAFVQIGKNYCKSNLKIAGYYATGVFCLTYCDLLCQPGMVCDCVERCKQTPGVLFKN